MPDTQLNTTEFDLDGFLGDLFGDKATEAKALFADEKVQTKLKESVLRQSDYDKKMNAAKAEVTARQSELAAKQESLNKLIELNTSYKGEAEKAVKAAQAAAQKEVDAARAQLAKVAKDAGYDDDEIEEIVPKGKTATSTEFNEDDILKKLQGKVVTPDVLDRLATGHINLILELDEVNDTYREYHAKRLTKPQKAELLAEFNKDLQKDQSTKLIDTATRLFKLDESKAARDKAAVDKLIEEARADERRKVEAERMNDDLPGPRRTGINSPLWTKTRKEGEKPTEGRGVRLAMEELAKQRAANAA